MPSNNINCSSSKTIGESNGSIDDDGIGGVWLDDTSFYAITTSSALRRNTILRCDLPKAGNLPSIVNKTQPLTPFHGLRNYRFRCFISIFCCLCSLVVILVTLTGKVMEKHNETAVFFDDKPSTRPNRFPHHMDDPKSSGRIHETPILFDRNYQLMTSSHDGHSETQSEPSSRASWATPSLYSKGTETDHNTDALYINVTNYSRQISLLSRLHDFPTISGGLPFYFHIPKSAGSTLKAILSGCYHLVLASDVGVKPDMLPLHPPIEKGLLRLVQNKGGNIYVNIQTTTLPGLHWARDNNFPSSGLADVVSSHLFFPTLEYLFADNTSSKGKVFTILRHPIERVLSLFYYLGGESSKHERSYNPSFKNLTLEEFLHSNKVESDWLTRKLNGDLRGRIQPEHVNHALEILRTKFLIGLVSHMEESLRRFELYFHWSDHLEEDKDQYKEKCIQNLIHAGGRNKNVDAKYQNLKENILQNPSSTDYSLLLQYNGNDMKLYQYAEQLFLHQRKIFFS